jgi:serine/threonine protein kinase
MTNRDIFLSHSSGDADAARELRAELEAVGYSCWMAPDDVDGTDPWAEQILRAVQDCRAMLVLISSHANQSPHVSREVNLALGRKRAVLPIRIENVQPEASLEYLLSLVQRVDAFPPPITNHKDRILRRLSAIVPLRPPGADASTATIAASRPPSEAATQPEIPAAPDPVPDVKPPGRIEVLAASEASKASGKVSASEPETDAPPIVIPTVGLGSRVGAFTIDEVIGEGGMATVYRATQDEPRRSVALKVIRADHASDDAYRNRFLAEKDTLASLEHPGIVPIYAAGTADGVLFIAMRRLDGPDLAGRLAKSGPMSLAETIVTLRPIADAIDYAHEMGVIHRDIKPSNIILDRGGRPYLTDFGLGKHLGDPRDLSAPGTTLGTLDYMAPEQFSGLSDPDLAGRTDVYALGCVAYACLTGAPPFRADEPQKIMYAHLHGAIPSLRDTRPDLPISVDAALRQALAKNPADRYATADEFIAALTAAQALATDRTAAVVVPPAARGASGLRALTPRGNGLGVAAVIAALLLAIGGGAVLVNSAGWLNKVAASTDAPSNVETSGPTNATTDEPTDPATDMPSGPPSDPPTNPPTDPPTRPPTEPPPPTDKPGPTPDERAPTGLALSIKGPAVITSKKVDLALKASGASEMRIGTASSATGTCGYGGWRSYSTSLNNVDVGGGSTDGRRWICAEFRDRAGNTAGPVRDSVVFDNAPVVHNGLYFSYSAATLAGKSSFTLRFFDPIDSLHIATDADGLSTLSVIDLWQIKSGGNINYSAALINGGTSAKFNITSTYCNGGSDTFTFGFTVMDEHGIKRNGTFFLQVCF